MGNNQMTSLADYMISAPLFKSVPAAKEALRYAGAQNVKSLALDSRYETIEFDLRLPVLCGKVYIRGIDKFSRMTVDIPASQLQNEHVQQFLLRLQEKLAALVPVESRTYALDNAAEELEGNSGDGEAIANAATIFVSYRRDDSADVTGRIYDRLVHHFGRESIFKDVDTIPLGADFRKVIENAVSSCQVLLAIIGRDWLTAADEHGDRRLASPTDFVRLEVATALQRDIPVIPVIVRGASVPKEAGLPESLKSLVYRNAIQVRPDPDFHNDVDRLIKGIESLLANT